MGPLLKSAIEFTSEAAIAPDVANLRRLSARLGRNPRLVQASNGNTSLKIEGALCIKASGRWLANAMREDSMVALELAEVHACVRAGIEITSLGNGTPKLRPSIETPMHAVLPHRVVIHVHSINTIAWAIRRHAEAQLADRLAGLHWSWVPYVASGIPLARRIEERIARAPETDVFVLGNHGLVVCGQDCDGAEALLKEVDRRLDIPPRPFPMANIALLQGIAGAAKLRIPNDRSLHALGLDAASMRILRGGILFPCQAMFLGESAPILPPRAVVQTFGDPANGRRPPFVIVEGAGVLLNHGTSSSEHATLAALAEVTQRTQSCDQVRYLRHEEVFDLMTTSAGAYRSNIAQN
jgi:rhamnose utilization protein RhaD (predicted bifunctional aldolase and dehydrogenase)